MDENTPNRFTIDLDGMEREDAPEPFTATLGGKVYQFIDAQEIDWRELIEAMTGELHGFFRMTLGDQAEEFLDNKLATWKLRKLMDMYIEHFGIIEPGNLMASSPR